MTAESTLAQFRADCRAIEETMGLNLRPLSDEETELHQYLYSCLVNRLRPYKVYVGRVTAHDQNAEGQPNTREQFAYLITRGLTRDVKKWAHEE